MFSSLYLLLGCDVAMITPYHFTTGGGERYFLTVMKNFQEYGCNIDVIFDNKNTCQTKEKFLSVSKMLGVDINIYGKNILKLRLFRNFLDRFINS